MYITVKQAAEKRGISVRIYTADKIVSKSALYNVPPEFKTQRKMLNRGLAEATPFFEADGIYILPVGGFGFRSYFEI